MHQSFYPSRFPIVEASMNSCSDLDLAIAVQRAGAYPSLYLQQHDHRMLQDLLARFISITGGANVVLPIWPLMLTDADMLDVIIDHGVSHCDLFVAKDNVGEACLHDAEIIRSIEKLKTKSKITLRIYQPMAVDCIELIDGFYIKGQESAGRTGDWSVRDLFLAQKETYPDHAVIPMGGIGGPEHVKWYLRNGAAAVGVGTLFAVCCESSITPAVKQRMISATRQDITLLSDTRQNALVFNANSVNQPRDDWNRIQSLLAGVTGKGDQGHVYIGHSIDHVDRLRSAQETVDYLMCWPKSNDSDRSY